MDDESSDRVLAVYRVEADSTHQSLVLEDDRALAEKRQTIWRFDGSEISRNWSPPKVRVQNANLAAPDIWSTIAGSNFAFNQRAARVLQTFLDQSGEQLQLDAAIPRLVFLNVTYVLNCLDKKRSGFEASSAQLLNKYVFHERRLEYPLFKIPETCDWELLTVEGTTDPNHDFKPLVEKHGLKGLVFTKLWSADEETRPIG